MAYKTIQRTATISAVEDAFSELETLGEEMRETYDNMEGANMGHMEKCQRAGEAADTLEQLQQPDPPASIVDLQITYGEAVNKDKRKGCSRAVRCSNACAVLRAASERAQEWLDDEANKEDESRDDVEQFINDIDDIADSAEGVDFPGMFG